MIASVGKGGGAGGAVAYALDEREERGKEAGIVANTTSGRTGREITQEFDALAALRPDVERKTFFGSLSAAPGEHLSDAQWGAIGRGWAEHQGFRTYVAVVHRDTDHEHIHLIASRVNVDGRLVSDRHDFYKAQAYARQVEQEYRLERVASSWEKGVERGERQPSRAVMERADRLELGEPLMLAARRVAGDDFAQAKSWEDLTARLDRHGLTIQPGKRGPGLVVSDGQETIKASDVGRAHSRANLEKRLGDYDRFVEREQQRRAEPVRLVERAPERGDAARISARYGGLAVSGPGPSAGRDPERAAEPGRSAVEHLAGAARGDADDGRGGADRRPGIHHGGGEGGGRAAGLQGADLGGGRGEGDRPAVGADRAQLGGAAPLPDVGGRGGAGALGVAPAGAPAVGEVGDRGRAIDERGAAGSGAHRGPGDPALPGPADPALAAVRDRGRDGVGAPGGGALPDSGDRAGIERALAGAQRAAELHRVADRAALAHVEAWAQLHRDPAGARRQFEAMQKSAPEIAADVLRRTPQAFGPLTEVARSGSAYQLARDVLKTGEQSRAAEGQRPRMPAAQVTAEVARLDGLTQPFRAQDRAQALERQQAREIQRALERSLGLGDPGRGR